MIKADLIEEADLTKIKELKRFLSKNKMRLGGDETTISFYGKGGNRWFYLRPNIYVGNRNKWAIQKSIDIYL